MRRFGSFITLFILLFSGFGQSTPQPCDSMQQLVRQSSSDTLKAFRLCLLAECQHSSHVSYSTQTARRALSLSKKLHYGRGISHAYRFLGAVEAEKHHYTAALKQYEKALRITETAGFYIETQRLYNDVLNVCFMLGDYPRAMKISLRGLKLSENHNDEKRGTAFINLIGFVYYRQKNYTQARKYFLRYYNDAKKINEPNMVANALSNLAEIHVHDKNYDKAITYLVEAGEIYQRQPYGTERLFFMWFSLSKAYKLKGDMENALRYALLAVERAQKGDVPVNRYDLAAYYIGAGEMQLETHSVREAIKNLHRGLHIASAISHSEYKKDAFYFLSHAYASLHMFDSAYIYQTLHTNIKDSILNEQTNKQVTEIHALYQLDKKDTEIELKKTEISKQKLLRNVIIAFSVVVLIMVILLYNRYRLRQKNKFQLELSHQQNEMFGKIIQVQETERKRVAEELHDGLGSLLSAVKLKMHQLNKHGTGNAATKQQYAEMMLLIDETIEEMRNVAHAMMPPTLSKLGLVSALRNLFDSISSSSGLRIHFSTHNMPKRLKEEIEIGVYRIVLEGINNAVKHASASEVTVQLIMYNDYLNVMVEDNGKGFDYKNEGYKSGLGITNITSRVNFMKGKLDIDSAVGRGTTMVADIPL